MQNAMSDVEDDGLTAEYIFFELCFFVAQELDFAARASELEQRLHVRIMIICYLDCHLKYLVYVEYVLICDFVFSLFRVVEQRRGNWSLNVGYKQNLRIMMIWCLRFLRNNLVYVEVGV